LRILLAKGAAQALVIIADDPELMMEFYREERAINGA
jgi:hypothetical protein